MKKNDQVRILATAVYLASQGKEGDELKEVVNNFLAYLNKHELNFLIPKILKELEAKYLADNNMVKAEIVSREKLDQNLLAELVELIKFKTNKAVVVKAREDKSILGGVAIRYEDKLLDMSLKNQLNKLAKRFS